LGQLNTGRTGLTSTFGIQDWTLDGLGNWSNFQQTVLGNIELTQSRAHNKANEVGTITNSVGAPWAAVSHDAAGNMTAMPKSDDEGVGLTCTCDAWNRLVKVSQGSTTVAEYEYDGLNRRIVKSLGTGTVKDHFYFNEDWQELEVRKETSGTISANPFEQFVWHPYYIDALATRFWDASTGGTQIQHYFTHDANFNVTSAVDTSGNVVERYDYSPYGEPIFLDANFDFDADSVSDIAHSRTYTGQRLDTETGLYQYRNRYYHAKLGRFITGDPIGYEGSPWNLYEYTSTNPLKYLDAFGNAIIPYDPSKPWTLPPSHPEPPEEPCLPGIHRCIGCSKSQCYGTTNIIIGDMLTVCGVLPKNFYVNCILGVAVTKAYLLSVCNDCPCE
jgi:RHS repeat-associated protein